MKTRNKRCAQGIANRLARFGADRSGNVAIMVAFSAIVLLLAIGAAVDVGRWLHARDQTAAAIDAAVLAGGRALQTDSGDTAGAIATAQKFYEQNVSSRLPVVDDTVTFSVVDGGTAIAAEGTAYIKTPFLELATIDKLPLTSSAKAELKQGGNLEISVMLDVTGSMKGQKLKDLKDAATDLIDIVVTDNQSDSWTKIALVPFSEDIRLPNSGDLNKARGTGLPSVIFSGWGWFMKPYYLSDCVVERKGAEKYTDAAPGPGQYVMAHYTEKSSGGGGWGWGWWGGGGSAKKGVCTIPETAKVVPLSSNKTTLKSKVDALSASGGTAGHLGTAWAWYTLSPNWDALWTGQSKPEPYGTQDLNKVAILMTDGEYNRQYDSNGVSASASQAANGSSTTQARALCQGMKDAGITIYAIGFDLRGSNSESYKTLQQCASDSNKFYDAADGEQLKQAFRDIAVKLSQLYLSK